MNTPQFRFILVIFLCLLQLPAYSKHISPSSREAKITESHGDVYKRGFIDWDKDEWGDPQPAKRGDMLQEGMQVGTGNKSWAQLTWTYITARAWENSVYAIAPNQRLVYLTDGEMLYHLDKHRKDNDEYYVWTKLVQARLRGTTVLFQVKGDTTRVTVLEGCVDVMNRQDKSVVRIEPGVVYEVKDLHPQEREISDVVTELQNNATIASSTVEGGNVLQGGVTHNAAGIVNTATGVVHDISMPNLPSVPLFQTEKTLTSLLLASPTSLLGHPLLSLLESPLSSLSLVTSTLNGLLGKMDPLLSALRGGAVNSSVATSLLNKALLSQSEVIAVPKTSGYKIGPLVGSAFTVPQASVMFFPPKGVIGQAGGMGLGDIERGTYIPSLTSAVTPAGTNTQALSGLSGLAGANTAGIAGLAGMTGTAGLAGVSGVSALSGVTGGIGSVGAVTGTASSLGTTVMSAGSALLPNAGAPVATTLSTVGGATGALGGTLGGVVNPVTHTIQTTTTTTTSLLGGLLGH